MANIQYCNNNVKMNNTTTMSLPKLVKAKTPEELVEKLRESVLKQGNNLGYGFQVLSRTEAIIYEQVVVEIVNKTTFKLIEPKPKQEGEQ